MNPRRRRLTPSTGRSALAWIVPLLCLAAAQPAPAQSAPNEIAPAAAPAPSLAVGAQAQADQLLDALHAAASTASSARYFGLFAPDAVFLGTDASERWTLAQFQAYAQPYFDKGQGWTYTRVERHILVSADGGHASFDELLDNASLGRCRGTGVLRRIDGQWKIEQYHLTIPVPNALAAEFAARIRAAR